MALCPYVPTHKNNNNNNNLYILEHLRRWRSTLRIPSRTRLATLASRRGIDPSITNKIDAATVKAKLRYQDVIIGETNAWQVLDEITSYMQDPMKYHHNEGVKPPQVVLISGPPGTGKTLLARAIASESGLPFVFASGAEFGETAPGFGAQKIFEIFFKARENAPAFIFIDDIDALTGKNSKDDVRTTLNLLLEQLHRNDRPGHRGIDRLSPRQAIVLICATNRVDELDESFLCHDHVDRHIHIGLPGEDERIEIFKVHSKGRPIAKDVDFSKLAFRTPGYSGADIRNVINEAGIMAVQKGRKIIGQQDLLDVLDKQLLEGMGMALTEEEQQQAIAKVPFEKKHLLAVHEAGHILLAHLFPRFDRLAVTFLLPGGTETGVTVFYPRQEMLYKGYTPLGYLKMQMVVAHGGHCAERLVFGDVSDGAQHDLTRISEMAQEITLNTVCHVSGLFPLIWKDIYELLKIPDEVELWDTHKSHIGNTCVELSEMFTRDVTRYVDETEDDAMVALNENRHILDRIVHQLLHRPKLSGDDVEAIMKSMMPIMLDDPMSALDVEINGSEMVSDSGHIGQNKYRDIYPAPLHRC